MKKATVPRGTKGGNLEGPQMVDGPDAEKEGPQDWEIEDAVRTMQKADKIKNDPKMMKHVHKHVNKQITSLKSLKSLAAQKALEEQQEGE